MPKVDKLGPKENQSPVWKHRATTGADLSPEADYVEDSLIGGNKHSATGGSRDEHNDNPGPVEKKARANYGTDTPEGPYDEDFNEGTHYEDRSQGATLTRGSID